MATGALLPRRDHAGAVLHGHFKPIADDLGPIILAPEATSRTWDLILGGFGPDVNFINRALHTAYQTVHVDANRIFTSGFSDAAVGKL